MSVLDILKDELTNDPLTPKRNYSGMTDFEAANDLNTTYRTRNKTNMTGTEIFNAIDKAEWNALSDAQRDDVWNILHLGNINPFGIEADLMQDIFGASTTITALQAARKENISRAEELGLGVVGAGQVEEARR